MRLVVKQKGQEDRKFDFAEGPVKIGRRGSNEVTLPDRSVSKHHAAFLTDETGKWIVKDLGSANKTYLNSSVITQAEIKTGDSIRISDFTLEITLDGSFAPEAETETETAADTAAELDAELDAKFTAELAAETAVEPAAETSAATETDTAQESAAPAAETDAEQESAAPAATTVGFSSGPQIVVRKPDAVQAPPIRFPAKRADDFIILTRAVRKAESLDKLLLELLNITSTQCDAFRGWCALRSDPNGPMTCHAGKHRNGQAIELEDLDLKDKINEAIEKNEFLLFVFSRVPGQKKGTGTRSVMIAPITNHAGCFGVIYIDNALGDEHYSLSDLDYLMMVAIHTASILEKL